MDTNFKNENDNPFTSKGYPFRKDLESYSPLNLGRAFFSDGNVEKNHRFEVFDHINLLNGVWLKDESLFYKKLEIPVYIYTTNSREELNDKYNRLAINYDEIALFFLKEEEKEHIEISINLGDSLLKLSNLKDEKEMENKRWIISSLELGELTNFFSAKKVVTFLNKNNELFNPDVENITGLFKKKTPVHFTIGMFFDGTGNNRFNSEKVYYKKLNRDNILDIEIPKDTDLETEKGKITIENDSSYWNSYSNIVLLHDLYEEKNKDGRIIDNGIINVILKQYVQGIGTLEDEVDDVPGTGFGEGARGIIGKVIEGCNGVANQMAKILDDNKEIGSITFDVYGFSRGAAAARHFCNEILGSESIKQLFTNTSIDSLTKNNGNTSVYIPKIKEVPSGKKYTLGRFGTALKKVNVQHEIIEPFTGELISFKNQEQFLNDMQENSKVKIRFLGLFDTVVSQIVVKYYRDFNLDLYSLTTTPTAIMGRIIELALDQVKQRVDNLPIEKIVHLVAQDEWRENFSVTPTNAGISLNIIGAHSDIGGGYAATKLEKNRLHNFSIKTGTEEEDIMSPVIDNYNMSIKEFFISKGYCSSKQIEIKEIGNTTTKINNITNAIDGVVYGINSTRQIVPRYSVVPMYVMHHLSRLSNVPFYEEYTLIPVENKKFDFEYITPKELLQYQKDLIAIAENVFFKKYESKKTIKKQKLIDVKTTQLIRNKFIHLSSNYNYPYFTVPKVIKMANLDFIKKAAYVNHPRVTTSKVNPYEREIYPINK